MINLSDQMRMIMAIEAIWILIGILLTGATQVSLILWMSVGWLGWCAYFGNLSIPLGTNWLLEKVRPYLKRT